MDLGYITLYKSGGKAVKKRVVFTFILGLFFIFPAFAGKNVPKFSFKSEDGKIVKNQDIKGKPTVLIFWGINCHSCKRELPQINSLYKKYKGKVNFFAVVIDENDIKEIKKKKKQWGFDIPVLIGERDTIYRFRVIGVPMMLILNKEGKIFKKFFGVQENEKVEKLIKTLL